MKSHKVIGEGVQGTSVTFNVHETKEIIDFMNLGEEDKKSFGIRNSIKLVNFMLNLVDQLDDGSEQNSVFTLNDNK